MYLVSRVTDAGVKVRDGLLDVRNSARRADGLEQWTPVRKAGSRSRPTRSRPSSTGCVTRAITRRLLARRAARRRGEGQPDAGGPRAQATAAVHNRQLHGRADRFRTDVGNTRTVAVESDDADAVTAAVRNLGLADLTNTSFPRGLKALAGPA